MSKFGIFFGDEPYQILNSMDFRTTPLAPLSCYLGGIYGDITNWSWLSFRYLGFALNVISILIGGFYMLRRTRDLVKTIAVVDLAVVFSGLFQTADSLYGWDRWTVISLMMTLVSFLFYLKSQNRWLLIVVGGFTAVAGLCRLPNYVAVGAVIVILMLSCRDRRVERFKSSLVYLVSVCVISVLLLSALYGNLSSYISSFSDNFMGAHYLKALMSGYLSVLAILICYIMVIWCGYHFLGVSLKYKSGKTVVAFFSVIIVLYVFYYALLLDRHNGILTNVVYYKNALLYVLIGAGIIWRVRGGLRCDKTDFLSLFAVGIIALVPCIGSNTGFLKTMALPVLPVAISFLIPYLNAKTNIFAAIAASALLLYSWNGSRNATFSDVGIKDATCVLDYGVLSGMRTSQENGDKLCRVIEDVAPRQRDGEKIIVFRRGDEYVWEYIFASRNPHIRHEWSVKDHYNNDGFTDKFIAEVTACQQPITLLSWAEISHPRLRRFIESNFTLSADRGEYKIYESAPRP